MVVKGVGGGCCCCGGDDEESRWTYEEMVRRADAVRAAEGLTAQTAYYLRIPAWRVLLGRWRARKVPVRNPQFPPRLAWQINPSLRAQIETKLE